jgi:hypothetical protein
MKWTLKYNGTEKKFAEWGIRNVKRTMASQQISTVTFEQPHATALDDPLFAEGSIVEIFRDVGGDNGKKRWFYGRVEDASVSKSGRYAGLSYTISDPWWWLANMGFRQSWKVRADLTKPDLVEKFTSYCLLGTKISDGFAVQQSIADQIAEAVNYAIGQGAPLLFDGQGLPTIFPPIRDVWNASVAEVIQKMIEWTPDIVCEFDHATEPVPTLRMRRRADQTPTTIDRNATLQIRPRNDLKVPGAIIYYIRNDSTNGVVYGTINEDIYPEGITGREPKALVAAINLAGASVTFTEVSIIGEPILPENVDWWKLQKPNLQSVQNLSVKAGSSTFTDEKGNPLSLALTPNKLIGQWAPWMGGIVQNVNVTALVSYSEPENSFKVGEKRETCQFVATNLQTNTYRSTQEAVSGEAQPIGLAEAMVKSRNVLHFEGRITLKEQDCSGTVRLGNVLNVSGGRHEWETMNAQIQSVVEEVDSGATTLVFGPNKMLGPADYIELLRATRNRFRYAAPESRASGVNAGNSAVLGQTVSKQVATGAQGLLSQLTFRDPTGQTPGSISFDLNDVGGKEIKFREVDVCVAGQKKKMRIPASDVY